MSSRPGRTTKHITLHRESFPTFGNEVLVRLDAVIGSRGSVTMVLTHTNVDGTHEEVLHERVNSSVELQTFIDEAEHTAFALNFDRRKMAEAAKALPRKFQTVFKYARLLGDYPLKVKIYDWDTGTTSVADGTLSLEPSIRKVGDVPEFEWSWTCTITAAPHVTESGACCGNTYREFLANLEESIYQLTIPSDDVDRAIKGHRPLAAYLVELEAASRKQN